MLEQRVARKIKMAREMAGMRPIDVCYKMGMSGLATYYRWEKGSWCGFDNLEKLAELYGRSPEWFFSPEDEVQQSDSSPLRSLQGSAFYSVPTDIFVSECVNF